MPNKIQMKIIFGVLLGAVLVGWIKLALFPEPPPPPLTPAQARAAQVQHVLDNAYYQVQAQIQSSMLDPDSFQRVAVDYEDHGSYLLMGVKFRGKNAFGALIFDHAEAVISPDGTVLSVGKPE
ncbi:hypothetical protein SFMTTN_2045 [Sulfuriferula multivorans]|uniref:Uncharacterized protein n=1 Tax=Sulfuriferula multivorans TaxID=1559896 RepID=A0A401JF24_9PROT|nr:hypothetical protein [Sulfuriferula multivorans]GBL46232.1 hypothetical protein SFMTTN_2045 [Sulfuriferula multivorans]